jgi:hypothetical protein
MIRELKEELVEVIPLAGKEIKLGIMRVAQGAEAKASREG